MLGEKSIHYPLRISELIYFYNLVVEQLESGLGAKYGIAPEVIQALRQHSNTITQTYNEAYEAAQVAQSKTQIKKDAIREGNIALKRVLKSIYSNVNFQEGDAELLLTRVLREKPNLREVKPIIRNITAFEEKIEIKWTKKRMEGVIVYGSYNGHDFEEVSRAVHSPFEDLRKNLAEHPEARYYKLRYFKNDKPIGQETGTVKIVAEIY